jgi:hypothetical protein
MTIAFKPPEDLPGKDGMTPPGVETGSVAPGAGARYHSATRSERARTPPPMRDLKLIALDAEDLAVVSTHLQDAVLRIDDMTYIKREKRFALIVNRFDWEGASLDSKGECTFTRRRTGLRFERVLEAKVSGLDLAKKDAVLSLLALQFEPKAADAPEGYVTLRFSGGGAVRLFVECIEAELKDLGAAWATRCKPEHANDDAAGKS